MSLHGIREGYKNAAWEVVARLSKSLGLDFSYLSREDNSKRRSQRSQELEDLIGYVYHPATYSAFQAAFKDLDDFKAAFKDYICFANKNFSGHRNKDGSIDQRTTEAWSFNRNFVEMCVAIGAHIKAVENAKMVLKRLKRKGYGKVQRKPYRRFRLRTKGYGKVRKPYRRFRLRKSKAKWCSAIIPNAHGITPNQLRVARNNLWCTGGSVEF